MQNLFDIKSLHLKLGMWLCAVMAILSTAYNFSNDAFANNATLQVLTLITVYINSLVQWVLVFAVSVPQYRNERLYSFLTITQIWFYSLVLSIGFGFIFYELEGYFLNEVEGLSFFHFVLMYGIRAIFQFGIAFLFKYLYDLQEQRRITTEEMFELRTMNERARFEILKQQINPHFLFNSLSTLKSLILMNDPNAGEFVMSLSEVYRKLLERREQDLVTLDNEMEIVNAYLFMQRLRFEDSLISEIEILPQHLVYYLPPFSLQLLIENVIKHNVISIRKPLKLRIFTNDDDMIVIENSLQPKKGNDESTGWGLSTLVERYRIFTSKSVEVIENETTFSVVLPLLSSK
jgi:two-component system, LytTR family, sensor kinase